MMTTMYTDNHWCRYCLVTYTRKYRIVRSSRYYL